MDAYELQIKAAFKLMKVQYNTVNMLQNAFVGEWNRCDAFLFFLIILKTKLIIMLL